jgi:uncharacterized membrane protein YbhN (UPF0104 family)
MNKLKLLGSFIILIVTALLFTRYVQTNPEVIQQIKGTNPAYLVLIGLLYFGVITSLTVVNSLSARLSGKRIGAHESFNLTSTSSIANFFGPLQGGIGIRAVYFNKKLKIPLKQFALVSLYYYGFYAFFSGIFLLFGSAQFRIPLFICLILGSIGTVWFIRKRAQSVQSNDSHVTLRTLGILAGTVLVQLSLITVIYFVELIALGKVVSFGQVISYSGAANFSLFVAITPGAIGIREAFLVFSEQLHHISRDVIVSANILDRGVYIVFLAVLFGWLILTHTRVQLRDYSAKNNR